jgi:predicted DCC family thiol-disulfide oxidoreductase YuxK
MVLTQSKNFMPIILFDGVCNFCNRTVNIILKYDQDGHFKFAPSQSIGGIGVLQKFNLNQTSTASVILIENDKVYTKTDAVIQIATHLKGWPRLFSIIKFIPKPIRDFGYDLVAKNRYTLFGKRETCRIPDESTRHRFLA